MLLKRIDHLGNKSYVNRFTGAKVELKYVGHKVKVKQAPSSRDAAMIEKMRYDVAYYHAKYLLRLAAYKARKQF